MGANSHTRIKNCDCNHGIRPTTVRDPCHTAFVYGCLRNMPDDLSCCPDPAAGITSPGPNVYVNATGGSDGLGTCIPKSDAAALGDPGAVIRGVQCASDHVVVVNEGCTDGDAEGMVCDADGTPQEAYCSYGVGARSCARCATNFVDDIGASHLFTKAQPTVVAHVMDALALVHMGMDPSQIIGTYGPRASSGSNLNSYYHAGFSPGGHGDHANLPYDAALFPSDPTPEEQVMLAQMHDLSPECSSINSYCGHFDHTILDANGWPDVILEGAFYQDWASTSEMLANASNKGIPVVRLRSGYNTEDESPTRGFIETVQRYEELTRALGVSDARVTAATAYAKATLCAEVEAFKVVALEAQVRGVRALAAYLPAGETAANGDIGGYIASPDKDSVLMMLEELGMPIMHSDALRDSAWEFMLGEDRMSATNLMSTGGRTSGRVKVPYPVDFWLYDQRVTLDFTSDSFAAAWPHPAVVTAQYANWPSNGHIHSYRHATTMLENVRKKLAVAEKLDPTESTCTAVGQSDWEFVDPHSGGGGGGGGHGRQLNPSPINLGPGQYACPNPVSYSMCEGMASTFAPQVWNFKESKPDFFPATIPAPMAYYYLGEGGGYDLTDSVSGNTAAGSVDHIEEHQLTPGNDTHPDPQPGADHSGPNWQADEYFGTSIACGKIDDTIIQKDTLSLADVDYGSSGSWAWSVWFRHEAGVNYPDYQREQFFGHGDPIFPTTAFDQVRASHLPPPTSNLPPPTPHHLPAPTTSPTSHLPSPPSHLPHLHTSHISPPPHTLLSLLCPTPPTSSHPLPPPPTRCTSSSRNLEPSAQSCTTGKT